MSINSSLVITVLGEDRPGLVERISTVINQHHGNWLGSHLSSMAGYFGGMVHVLVPTDQMESLIRSLRELEPSGLSIVVKSGLIDEIVGDQRRAVLEVVGNDRPGIVSTISRAIASHGINVEELRTDYTSAPMSGIEMFSAKARLYLPSQVSAEDLRKELEQIAGDLMVDIELD